MAPSASSARWVSNAEFKSTAQTRIDPRAPDFLSSHPATPERVKNAQAQARQFGAPGGGERDRAEYLASIDGMVYGEDPSEGFVRGRRFLHPKLGFTFVAPDGFALDNTAQAVLGVKQGGGQALRLDVVRVPAEQSLRDYLNSGWIEDIDGKSVEELTINGFPAATALAKGDHWAFRLFALRFGSDVYRFIFAAKKMTPGGRSRLPRIGHQLPPHEPCGKQRGQADAAARRDGRPRRHRRAAGEPDGQCGAAGRALPRAQWARPHRPRAPR